MKRSILVVGFAALTFATCSTSGFADADAQRGKQFALRVCHVCHIVAEGQKPGDPDAPSFQSIAKGQHFREKGERLLWEEHPKMPNLAITQEESDDLAAYIRSLAE
jgi:mono/diheme cytochrome c family protein